MQQHPSKKALGIGLLLTTTFITISGSALSSVEGNVTTLIINDGKQDQLVLSGDEQVQSLEAEAKKGKTAQKDQLHVGASHAKQNDNNQSQAAGNESHAEP
ncbi:hypothetical protein [Photobacterium galatheae]|uniref:Uncharacterized protein n=1 Tax=Photobacterium galatheae TaxID=1654360 RepID=A0A066RZI8_9GAMM|nr:hypothetical protein [Photobacterium galatheae]KDM93107.1 hypothetical protein EA58_02645 [Photobacterium galatheae]MCM0148365.1 hypothetical protein [Photobacterium galatheae]